MADSYLIRGKVDTAEELKEKMIDNGDGTHSSGVAVTGSSVRSGTVTVATHNATTASTTASAANANLVFRKIQNMSDTNITLNLAGGTAVALAGVVLLPFGIYESQLGDYDFTTGAITCIHAGSGNKALAVTSGVA
jgi:hypothetical protein